VGRRVRGVYDEEEECEGECKGEGYGRAIDAKVGVVHEVDVERDIDGGYENEHVGRRIHDPYNWQRAVNLHVVVNKENIP
jgi:hypothetical protein